MTASLTKPATALTIRSMSVSIPQRLLRWAAILALCLVATFALNHSFLHASEFGGLARINGEDRLWLARSLPSSWRHVGSLFFTANTLYYRPVYVLWVAAMQWAFGLNCWTALHVGALALEAVVAWLLIGLVQRIWHSWPASVVAGAILLLHPNAAVAAWWISANSALLAMIAYLAALHFWLWWREDPGRGWAAAGTLAAVFLALASKEDAYSLPLVLAAMELIAPARPRRAAWMRIGAVAAVLIVNLWACGRIPAYISLATHHHQVIASGNKFDPAQIHGVAGGGAYAVPRIAWSHHPVYDAFRFYVQFVWSTTLEALPIFPLDWISVLAAAALIAGLWPSLRRSPLLCWSAVAFLLACLPVPLGVPQTSGGTWYQFPPACLLAAAFSGLLLSLIREAKARHGWRPILLLSIVAVQVVRHAWRGLDIDFATETLLFVFLGIACGLLWYCKLIPGPLALTAPIACALYPLAHYYVPDAPLLTTATIALCLCGAVSWRIGLWPGVLLATLAPGIIPSVEFLLLYFTVRWALNYRRPSSEESGVSLQELPEPAR